MNVAFCADWRLAIALAVIPVIPALLITSNTVLAPKIKVSELDKMAGKLELKPGAHYFELHQAIGDRPQALGRCVMMVSPVGQTKFAVLSTKDVVQPLYTRVAALEGDPHLPPSLVVEDALPECLQATARGGGVLMAMRHRELPAEGVQFHPESVLTPDGKRLLENFLA